VSAQQPEDDPAVAVPETGIVVEVGLPDEEVVEVGVLDEEVVTENT